MRRTTRGRLALGGVDDHQPAPAVAVVDDAAPRGDPEPFDGDPRLYPGPESALRAAGREWDDPQPLRSVGDEGVVVRQGDVQRTTGGGLHGVDRRPGRIGDVDGHQAPRVVGDDDDRVDHRDRAGLRADRGAPDAREVARARALVDRHRAAGIADVQRPRAERHGQRLAGHERRCDLDRPGRIGDVDHRDRVRTGGDEGAVALDRQGGRRAAQRAPVPSSDGASGSDVSTTSSALPAVTYARSAPTATSTAGAPSARAPTTRGAARSATSATCRPPAPAAMYTLSPCASSALMLSGKRGRPPQQARRRGVAHIEDVQPAPDAEEGRARSGVHGEGVPADLLVGLELADHVEGDRSRRRHLRRRPARRRDEHGDRYRPDHREPARSTAATTDRRRRVPGRDSELRDRPRRHQCTGQNCAPGQRSRTAMRR